jgi:pimeloyl-ACP methyl ester carboxylesterase
VATGANGECRQSLVTFALIPGAGGASWYWHRVVPILEEAKHEAIAVDLPGDDARAGLSVYAERVLEAIGTREVILVAQSLGGFTAPLVCARARTRMLAFVNAMIPVPGETAGEWWANTGWEEARVAAARRGGYSQSFDLATYFLHDLPPDVVKQGEAEERPEADVVFGEPCRFATWPAIPIHVIAGRDDRFFPIEFQRRVAQERLQVPVDELPGGHLLALANPRGLADQLLGYLRAD